MKVRRGEGRVWAVLERESLGDALSELAKDHGAASGWARGVGKLRWVELAGPGRVRGPLVLLSLEGSLGPEGQLAAAVARADGAVLGGVVVDAGAERVELWVEPFIEASDPAPTQSWVAPADDEPAGSTPSWGDVAVASAQKETDTNAAVTWQQVAAASEPGPEPEAPRPSRPMKKPRRRSSAVAELLPQKGDFIQHRQFGRCKVHGPSKGGGVVVALPSGIRKTIRLDYLDVGQPRDENGRRVFPVRPKKR